MNKRDKRSVKQASKYSLLARLGLQHFCAWAILDMKKKVCASSIGEIFAPLKKRVYYDILDHEEEMMHRLLNKEDFKYFKSWSSRA